MSAILSRPQCVNAVVWAATSVRTHAAAILSVNHPALNPRVPWRQGRQSRTRHLPHYSALFISQWPPFMSPLTQLTHSHSQLTYNCSWGSAMTWVSNHSEISGRNSVVQSVRSQCRCPDTICCISHSWGSILRRFRQFLTMVLYPKICFMQFLDRRQCKVDFMGMMSKWGV